MWSCTALARVDAFGSRWVTIVTVCFVILLGDVGVHGGQVEFVLIVWR